MGVTAVANDGIESLPSLRSCCDLFRAIVNDTFSSGQGQIATDDAPFMRPLLNSAIRDLWAELRLVGDLRVVRDNYIVSGIPALAVADPTFQVALTYQGYFDGVSWSNQWQLPPDLLSLQKVWVRPSGSGSVFLPAYDAGGGLAPVYQTYPFLASFELRGFNELWMAGSIAPFDLRLRYTAAFPDLVTTDVDFSATYIPIADSTNAIANKMVATYAQRQSPDQFPLAEQQAVKYTQKLIRESILNSQVKQFDRATY